MPASLDRTRRNVTANIRELARSVELTIKIKAYDSGMVEVYGEPMDDSAWLGAAETVMLALGEFRRQAQAVARQRQ